MKGRFFAGRQVEASLFTGGERFQLNGVGEDPDDESTAKEGKKQLYDSAQWIMKEEEWVNNRVLFRDVTQYTKYILYQCMNTIILQHEIIENTYYQQAKKGLVSIVSRNRLKNCSILFYIQIQGSFTIDATKFYIWIRTENISIVQDNEERVR